MKQKTIIKNLGCLASIGVALCLARSASAADSHWNGTPTDSVWNDPNNWTPAGVPQSVLQGLDPINGGNVWLDPANGDSVITIPAGDVENPGVGGGNPP